VDLDRYVINVQRSAWEGSLQLPKTGAAIRSFGISPQLAEHIRAFLSGSVQTGLLFRKPNGSPYNNYTIVALVFKPLCKKLGWDCKRMGLHALRHGSASAMDSIGTPMKVRQDRLGHTDAGMTMKYTHALSSDHRIVAEALGRMFDPTQGENNGNLDERSGGDNGRRLSTSNNADVHSGARSEAGQNHSPARSEHEALAGISAQQARLGFTLPEPGPEVVCTDADNDYALAMGAD